MAGPKAKAVPAASSLSTDDFASLASAQLGALGTADFATGLTSADTAALTTLDVSVLSTIDLAALGSIQIGALSTAVMVALSTGDIQMMGAGQSASQWGAAIEALASAQVVAVVAAQFGVTEGIDTVALALEAVDEHIKKMPEEAFSTIDIDGDTFTIGVNDHAEPEPSLIEQLVAASRTTQSLGDYTMHAEIEGLIDALQSLKMRLARATVLPAALVEHIQSLL